MLIKPTILLMCMYAFLPACSSRESIRLLPLVTSPDSNINSNINSNIIYAPRLSVQGHRLIDANGNTVRLRGVNINSLEYNMGEPPGTGWSQSNLCSSIPHQTLLDSVSWALETWHVNFIRLPINEDFWFGQSAIVGNTNKNYVALIDAIVDMVEAHHAYIDIDLHWSDAGHWNDHNYLGQHKMPDAHSVLLLTSVAEHYKNNPAVLFGVYNEPHHIDANIWYNGGYIKDTCQYNITCNYNAPGMQTLVDTIRQTGAQQIIIVGGLVYASRFDTIFPNYAINDNNVMYDAHIYPQIGNVADWDYKVVNPLFHKYPVLIGEFAPLPGLLGRWTSGSAYLDAMHKWLEDNQFSYSAWVFRPGGLIDDWCYTPSTYFGAVVYDWLQQD